MFLVRGELHHEATWAAWFSAAAGTIPLAQLHSTNCSLAETGKHTLSYFSAAKEKSCFEVPSLFVQALLLMITTGRYRELHL